jgi:hypothetical protein
MLFHLPLYQILALAYAPRWKLSAISVHWTSVRSWAAANHVQGGASRWMTCPLHLLTPAHTAWKCQGGSPCEYCIRTKKQCEPQAVPQNETKFVSWTTSPQPLQLAKLSVQVNERFEDTYLGYFSLFMQGCQFTQEFANFGADILPLIQTCPPLREATIAIGALEASRRATVNSSREQQSPNQVAFGSYGKSIRELQSWLQSADTPSCQGSLWCTILLTLFEVRPCFCI